MSTLRRRRLSGSSRTPDDAPLDIGVFGARGVPSTYSGYETFLSTLLPELARRGHRVTMYCRKGEVDGDGPWRGVHRVVLPALPGKELNTLTHGALASVRARVAGHDVLLVVNAANALFSWFNRLTNQPVVLNTDGQEWLRGKWGPIGRRVFRLSAAVAKRSANGLVADCQAMADVFSNEFGAASTVIPYCSPPLVVQPRPEVFAHHGVTERSYFVTGGRLNPENNIDGIATRYAASEAPDPLLVLGAANYDSPVAVALASLAERDPRIRIVGHVGDRDEYLTLLRGATGYLHGHSVGGMNPSLVEAMHAGALIAALDTTFNREVLADTGLFFPGGIGRVEDISQVIADMGSLSIEESDGLRDAARARADHHFGIDAVTEAYESALRATAAAPRRGAVVIDTRWSS
jgi:glycosyltransferase involved in cell wall biosynthesis